MLINEKYPDLSQSMLESWQVALGENVRHYVLKVARRIIEKNADRV